MHVMHFIWKLSYWSFMARVLAFMSMEKFKMMENGDDAELVDYSIV